MKNSPLRTFFLCTTFFEPRSDTKRRFPFCCRQSLFNLIFYGRDQRIGKREIYKVDRNPPITARERYLLKPLNSSFSFSETYSMMIGGSEKRNRCLNFKCPVLVSLKSAIF